MKKYTIWFNKSLSDIVNVAEGIRAADIAGRLKLVISHPVKDLNVPLPWCDFHHEPAVDGQKYLDWCLQFCTSMAVDVFVCGKQAGFLANHVEAFAAVGTKLVVATTSANFNVLDDKDLTYRALIAAGAGDIVPAYALASTGEQFVTALDTLSAEGKLCFKPTVSVFGIGFRIISDESNKTGLDRLLSGDTTYISKGELGTMMAERPSFKTLMVLPYLDGNERSIDCLAHNGKLVACVIRRKVSQGQVLEHNPELVRHVERLVSIFGLNNFFNAQFREKNGRFYLLEVNPRMSGGTHYTFHSGLTLPYLGVMLNLGLLALEDLPVNRTGVRVYPVEGSVSVPVAKGA
jgi:hypothetical protein